MYKTLFLCLVGLTFLAVGTSGEVVSSLNCTKTTSERKAKSVIHSVSVSPCAAAPEGPCEVTRGNNVTINIEFTPTIATSRRLRHSFFWERSPVDLPLTGMDPSACKFMNCSLKANVPRSYTTVIPLRRSFPASTYPVKIKLYQGSKVIVCQIVNVRLV